MRDTDAAWLAGFFDGEGCIYIEPGRSMVQVVNTCAASCERVMTLLTELGAEPRMHPRSVVDPERHKQGWVVVVQKAPHIVVVADAVMPYATTKAERWALVREHCAERVARGSRRRTAEEREHDADVSRRLREMNRTGPVDRATVGR